MLYQEHIEANKIVFLCIQIQCASTWGLIPKIISTLTSLKVEVIDNRSWHPRGVDSTLMTEIFVQDDCFLHMKDEESGGKTIEDRIAEVNEAMSKAIRQPVRYIFVTYCYLIQKNGKTVSLTQTSCSLNSSLYRVPKLKSLVGFPECCKLLSRRSSLNHQCPKI